MTITPYDWQNRLLRIYKGNGVIKAFAGTGKTYASILLIKDKTAKLYSYNTITVDNSVSSSFSALRIAAMKSS